MDKLLKVLLVEDEPTERKIIYRLAERPNTLVLEAGSAEEGWEIFKKESPDMALLDIVLPGIDGIEFCRKLRKHRTQQVFPIIFITARNDPNTIIDGYEAGANDYIEKPIHGAIFRACFDSQIRRLKADRVLAKTQKQLFEKKRIETMGLFATGMAHNFNNIFASVVASAELLKLTAGDVPVVEQAAMTIENAVRRGSELTSALLTFSHLSNPEDSRACDHPFRVLQETVTLFQRIDCKGITFTIESSEELPSLDISTADLSRILLELLKNAIASIQSCGEIVLSVRQIKHPFSERDLLLFSIKDNGCGISEENLNKLFLPFAVGQQGDSTLDIALDGSGMGLTICYNLVDKAGGFIEVKDTSSDGTTISFTVPITDCSDSVVS